MDILSYLYAIWQSLAQFFADSFFIAVLKFFLFAYVSVLLIDIVLLFMLRGVAEDLKRTLFGGERPLLSRSTIISRWEKILSRLEGDNPSQYKVAVLEADAFAEEILDGIGYKGAQMGERLDNIQEGQLETKERLTEAHLIRNRIVHETDYALSREEAKKCLDSYRAFFEEIELF